MTAFSAGSLCDKSSIGQAFALSIIVFFALCVSQVVSLFVLVKVFHIPPFRIASVVANPQLDTVWVLKIVQIIQGLLVFVGSSLAFAYFVKKPHEDYLNLRKTVFPVVSLYVVLTMVAVQPFISWLGSLNERMALPKYFSNIENWMKASEKLLDHAIEVLIVSRTTGDLMLNLLMIAVIPAVGEELLFRGCLQKLMIKGINNVHVAIICTAIIFSAVHLQFYGFFPRLFLGMLLGYLFYWSGSIWCSVAAHLTNNALAVFYMSLNSTILHSKQVIPAWQGISSFFLASFLIAIIYRSLNRKKFNVQAG